LKKAILLLNMGGPNTLSEVKLFLHNMFHDKAIIGAPFLIRKMIAYFIVKGRLKVATANYEKLGGISPIVENTKNLVEVLQKELDLDVFYIMRYTPPFAHEILSKIQDYERFYVIPLYPHFSTTTTLSSLDDLYEAAESLGIDDEKFSIIDQYYNNKIYNQTIVDQIRESLGDDNPQDFELIFSAHGLPQRVINRGDPYQIHIKRNVYWARKALSEKGIEFYKTHLAYQSRLGPIEWIKPYLDEKLKTLEKKRVIIYPIAFLIDNSETKYELDIQYREIANQLGFMDYRVAEAPNTLIKDTIIDLYQKMQ